MLDKAAVATLSDTIAPYTQPVLSLYLDVNPANPDNVRKAHVRRAKDALRRLDLPKNYVEDIVQKINLEHVIPQGRTLVVFAGEDPSELFETFYLQTELALLDLSDGALAHWGKPFIAPIMFAVDEHERYGLAYVSSDEWRYFEVFLGEIVELRGAERLDPSADWRRYTQARRSPGVSGPVQGGSDHDSFAARQEDWTLRHYREAAEELVEAVDAAGIERLVLIGQDSAIRDFESQLPAALESKVVARTTAPSNTNLNAAGWLTMVSPVLERVEREHEDALLSQVRESGIWGVDDTLAALQEGRLNTLLLPWGANLQVLRCDESGRVSTTEAQAEQICVGETHTAVAFKAVLPELVERHGPKVEFLSGAPSERLRNDFGGLAGVLRW